MPPHCDSRNGPVVKAARKALEMENVHYILPWVPKDAAREIREAYGRALRIRRKGRDVLDLADDWFFETAVRLHRAGEGASYLGLRPEGLDEGPVVPLAEAAVETGNPQELLGLLAKELEKELRARFKEANARKRYDVDDVEAGRRFVQAYLNAVVFSHHLYTCMKGEVHAK